MDFFQKCMCRKFGNMFKYSVRDALSPVAFTKQVLRSDFFEKILNFNVDMVQSALYFYNSFRMECEDKGLEFPECHDSDENIMFWAGYLFSAIAMEKKKTGREIADEYEIADIINSYDVLHTLSIPVCIARVDESFTSIGKIKGKLTFNK